MKVISIQALYGVPSFNDLIPHTILEVLDSFHPPIYLMTLSTQSPREDGGEGGGGADT
jgi:hypothetical protein